MRILFLTDNFPPEVNAPASRTYEHCIEWVRRGVEVTVITCVPNFPQGKVFNNYKNKWRQEETMDGIRVIRVWSYISANEGFAKRILDYVSFGVTSFLHGLFVKTDLIVATSPQFFTAVSGRWLSLCKWKPWVMEVRDLWPESIKAVSAMKSDNMVFSYLEWVEKRLYKSAEKIIVVTDAFRDKIASRGIDKNKISVVKNGVLMEKFKPVEKNRQLLSRLGLEEKFVFGYLGTHGMAHKLDFIVECAAKITEVDIHFLFIGNGAQKENVRNLAEQLKLSNCTFLDSVPKNEIADYISITDVALVNLMKSETFLTVIPSKIFENASMQKPILLGVEGESKSIIEQYDAGICFEPENDAEFLDAVHRLKSDNQLYKKLQEGCKHLALDFDRRKLALKMLEIFNQVT